MSEFSPLRERWIWLAVGLAAGAGLALWIAGGGDEGAAGTASEEPTAESSVVPTPAPGAGRLECYLGVVLAREAVSVAAEIEGILEEVRVRVGDRLAKGAVVATLDTRNLHHQLTMERAALRNTEAERRRQDLEVRRTAQEHRRRLELGDLASDADKEAARFQHEMAQARLEGVTAEVARAEALIEQLEATIRRSEIRAPFNATVAQRYLDPGTLVQPGTAIVRLIGSDSLLARFAVPPEDVAELSVRTPVRVEVEELGTALDGVVEHLAPEIDAASQMVFVEAHLDDDAGVPSGATARVSVARPGEELGSCLPKL